MRTDALKLRPALNSQCIKTSTVSFFLAFFCTLLSGQISIDQSNDLEFNPENLVRNVFIGQGVNVMSVDYQGAYNGFGVFRNGLNDIGIDRGIVISTGTVDSLANSNNDQATGSATSGRTVTNEALSEVAGSELFDVAVIEIEFRPVDEKIEFNFVFGSEEYPEFVCSQFNDVFAFFIDGPDPSGGDYISRNIALVPDPNDPTGKTLTDYPVTINSVNNGEIGTENLGDCTNPGESLDFSTYFNDNRLSRTFTLDGFLDVFRAQVDVMPCELYTLRLAIGDGFDDAFDSAVFLEAKSFSSTVHTIDITTPGADYSLMEGCDPAVITLSRTEHVDTDLDIVYEILEGPSYATRGEDYTLNRNDMIIPAGETSIDLKITPLDDGQTESEEMIYVVFQNGNCFKDTIVLSLLDFKTPKYSVPSDTMLCEGDKVRLNAEDDLNQLKIFEKSGEFIIGDEERGVCRSTIVVSDLDAQYLNENSFVQVCIDQLEHQWLGEMEIYLVAPDGKILELSTNNGEDGGNGDGMDQLINTCFTLKASDLINNGNAEEGTFLASNPTYTGNFLPEQDFDDLFGQFYSPANGKWSLVIRDAKQNDLTGVLYQWSLKFSPKYTEVREFLVNGQEVVGSSPIIGEDATLQEIITQNFGCSYENTTTLGFTALPEAPSVTCSNPYRNQIHLEWDEDDVDEYELKIGNGQWQVINEETSYLVDNLGLGADYSFEIRAVRNGCLGLSEFFQCKTPECANAEISVDQIIPTTSACIDDGTAEIRLASADGPFTYSIGRDINEDGIFRNLALGAYRVFATDRYGCSYVKTIEVTGVEPIELDVTGTKVSCDIDIKGTAAVNVLGGKGPYTYQWSNGSTDNKISKIEVGTYEVTVVDVNGCEQSSNIEILPSEMPTLQYTQENVTCYELGNGSVAFSTSGGEAPYEYRWADGYASVLPNRKNLAAGAYEVSVIDKNRCYDVVNVVIEQPAVFTSEIDKLDNSCFGTEGGVARLGISGGTEPYNVFWSNGDTNTSLANLKAGEYGVTITDAEGCRTENSVTINEPSAISIAFDESPISCFKGENGVLAINIEGGTGNYSYAWDNGGAFQTINNLAAGRYCVSVSDDNGCVIEECYVMTEPPSMTVDVETTDITCYESPDGALQISVNGGNAPYTIEMNGEVVAADGGKVENLRAGLYFVKVIDNEGCSISEVMEVKEAPEPSIFADVEHIYCTGQDNGSIFLRYLNEPNAKMLWTDDKGNEYEGRYLQNLYSGSYSYEILTKEGCNLKGVVEVEEPSNPLRLDVEYTDIQCYGDRNGEIVLTGQGGSGKYFYSLQRNGNGFQRNGLYQGLREGVYPTFIQDENGCTVTGDTIVITEPAELKVRLGVDTVIESGTDLPIEIYTENGQGELNYIWDVSPDQQLSCVSCGDQYINNVEDDFVVRLIVEDENFCDAQDEMQVYVIKDYTMYVPTGFSPNGDANNELLNVFGPDFARVKEFNVYLRNGTNIYNAYDFRPNDMLIGWNGRFRDKKMPAGIYIWTMHVEYDDGAQESFKGSVQLIR